MERLKKNYIGDKAFYVAVLSLTIPMMAQQGVTSVVNFLDNIMVGRLGTEAMSGVSIVNQLMFVYQVFIFGCVSAAGIFSAQFFGKKDIEGYKNAYRFKLILGVIMTFLALIVFNAFGDQLIKFYINRGESEIGNLELAFDTARKYLNVMLIGLPPFMLTQCYSSSLREAGETKVPMYASFIALFTNLILNYILIFGKLGFEPMGALGAGIATSISRYIEVGFIILIVKKDKIRYFYFNHIYETMKITNELVKKIFAKGMPLLLNEVLWSIGMATIMQNYSTRGLHVMAAMNISSTISSIFMIILFALGSAIQILVGQHLGAGEIEEAIETNRKLLVFTLVSNIFVGLILISLAKFVPLMYNTETAVRDLATSLIVIYGIAIPMHAYNHGIYFGLRSGGKTILTLCFDSFYLWIITVPLSYFLCRHSQVGIIGVYAIVQFADLIKVVFGTIVIKSRKWAINIIND